MTAAKNQSLLLPAWNAFRQGQFSTALALLESLPDSFDVLFFRGTILLRMNDYASALQSLLSAKQINSSNIDLLMTIGVCYQNQGDYESADRTFNEILGIDRNHLACYRQLVRIYLEQRTPRRIVDLIDALRQRTKLPPDLAVQFSRALAEIGNYEAAISTLRQQIAENPVSADTWNDLGNIYASGYGDWRQAIQCFASAIKIDPTNTNVHLNYGFALQQTGQWRESLAHYDAAIANLEKNSDNNGSASNRGEDTAVHEQLIKAKYNTSIIHLTLGNNREGWQYYRSRPSLNGESIRLFQDILPENLAGKNILVTRDQGLGDELFFLRFFHLLENRGATVHYHCHPKLKKLLDSASTITLIDDIDASKYDYVISVADLPWVLQEFDYPEPIKLEISPELKQSAERWLAQFGPPPYIGITWRAGAKPEQQWRVATRLSKQAPMIEWIRAGLASNYNVVVLQRDPDPSELQALREALPSSLIDASEFNDDLLMMAAILSHVQHYICVSNTNLHIRASLGKTADVVIPFPPEWRWGVDIDSSPWYSSLRLFRQSQSGDWSRVNKLLEKQMSTKSDG